MKGILLTDFKTGNDILIDIPDILPQYSIGTKVIAKIMTDKDEYESIQGDIVHVDIQQEMDLKDGIITTIIGYKILKDSSEEVYDVHQDEIAEFYADTNEYDIKFHIDNESE